MDLQFFIFCICFTFCTVLSNGEIENMQADSGLFSQFLPSFLHSSKRRPEHEGHSGVKTSLGVKTSHGGLGVKASFGVKGRPPHASGGRYQQSSHLGGCSSRPPAPMNGFLRCSSSRCKAGCVPLYQFPNGETETHFECVDGNWKGVGTDWDKPPGCEPICSPPCENNGICISPGICQCSQNFRGPQCQFGNKPCLNLPPLPTNSHRQCSSLSCTIKCAKGHQFPDGSTIANIICKEGNWVPTTPGLVSIPNCEPTCTPSCQNGGVCLSYNVCECPQGYRGPQCQYSADVCKAKKMGFNGGFSCTETNDEVRCRLNCPLGIEFDSPPASEYVCYFSEGIFRPTPIPQCVYGAGTLVEFLPPQYSNNIDRNKVITSESHDVLHGIGYSDYGAEGYIKSIKGSRLEGVKGGIKMNRTRTVVQKLRQPYQCYTWGGLHFKTFDNLVYSFKSECSHILVRDAVTNLFDIIVKNSKGCETTELGEFCHKIIKIFLSNKVYDVSITEKGVPFVLSEKKRIPIPGQVVGMRIDLVAGFLYINMDSVGVSLKWDMRSMIEVIASPKLWNRTEGLCGNLDGNSRNDMMARGGIPTSSISTFASSWQVDGFNGVCGNIFPVDQPCADPISEEEALAYCKNLLLDERFKPCQEDLDIKSLLATCLTDYCLTPNEEKVEAACQTMNVYMRICIQTKKIAVRDWRDDRTCPLKCQGGRIYKSCGSTESQTCASPMTGVSSVNDVENCEEGCFCVDGMVFHNNECIKIENCPCKLRGKMFEPGATISKDCNTCTCEAGKWTCTQKTCGSRCSSIGDPHYVTFDGFHYDFMGKCSYYLMKDSNYSIQAENVACPGSISEGMNFPVNERIGKPSCTKAVTINLKETTIKLKQNKEVIVNNKEINKLPYTGQNFIIRVASSSFITVELPNDVIVWWDGNTRVYIDAPPTLFGQTKGLCGTFNMNQNDDFLTPEGDVEQSIIPFANKWKTEEECTDVSDKEVPHPCEENIHRKSTAEQYCSKITSELFSSCFWYVDPQTFYKDCLYDMCACKLQISKCLCPIVASYAAECAQKGVIIEWRKDIRECGIQCPTGQIYRTCSDSCSRSCADIALSDKYPCKSKCVEGCNCPEGQTLNENGECIPIGQCPCQHNGLEFPPGFKEIRPGKRSEKVCTCIGATWSCTPATEDDIKNIPRARDLKEMCKSSNHEVFTTCEPAEPITCKNMHSPAQFTPAICKVGCVCEDGYVLDSVTKKCIRPETCPCHHGGKSYPEKAVIQENCNTCTCSAGKWECTDRVCTGYCMAWGDSHFRTFDGRIYDFQGSCDYVLAKGTSGKNEEFDVTIQNIPCGTTGVTCSKSVTLSVGSDNDREVITLTRDKPIPDISKLHRISVKRAGIYVIIEVVDLGLILQWDMGTRIYIKANPKWKNRVSGLCGNYNDNQLDDFQTPSGGVAEASARLFGDSWRLHPDCPEAIDVTDTCKINPNRRIWAISKCGVLKSSIFKPCHSEVPVEEYLERCIFDTCACDGGGDCECLCTAIATYAQECNVHGIPIRWRSQDLCPMQCDETCSEYAPCISSCSLETCDNTLKLKSENQLCHEDVCIEGCKPKPCPEGEIYVNSTSFECVPKAVCPTVCLELDGVIYNEGDLISEDECHRCFCSKHQKVCTGEPCSSTVAPVTVTIATELPHKIEKIQCVPGWSSWINNYAGEYNYLEEPIGTVDKNKIVKVEKLPTLLEMSNLQNSSVCEISQMRDIECRVVDTHVPSKETNLDVECSLERGLVCQYSENEEPCPDFEIRVLCDCGEFIEIAPGHRRRTTTTTPTTVFEEISTQSTVAEFVTEKVSQCPPDSIFQTCAIMCNQVCLPFLQELKMAGYCVRDDECIQGCVQVDSECLSGFSLFWKDNTTCIPQSSCSCMSHEGTIVPPGKVFQESPCEFCQCLNNVYVCDDSSCKTTTTEAITTTTIEHETEHEELAEGFERSTTYMPIIISTTVSPPKKCSKDNLEHLITGDKPLSDQAFSASSYIESNKPADARLNNKPSGNSAGSWKPAVANSGQFLQIKLNRLEPVYGIIVQGDPIEDEFVTSYRVLHSEDGNLFSFVTDKTGKPQIFRGPIDSSTPAEEMFDIPVETKYIRVEPLTWNEGISMRVELIGCSEPIVKTTTTETPQITTSTVRIETTPTPPVCVDPLGVNNKLLPNDRITFSSEFDNLNNPYKIALSSDEGWQPALQSPEEYVQFDFMNNTLITGLETKGGKHHWVTAYKVRYSSDGLKWNDILNKNGKITKFIANFNENTPKVNYFKLPIKARYLRIYPLKWHKKIQMRIEPIGCFVPYPKVPEVTTTPPAVTVPEFCNVCPGVNIMNESNVCTCGEDKWWSGEKCVVKPQCPCIYNDRRYDVGTLFSGDNCTECICKIGGLIECSLMECPKCKSGLKSELTATCACVCKECPENTVLCPTNDICIDKASWCNGIEDCPDDEINCKEVEEEWEEEWGARQTKTPRPIEQTTIVIDKSERTKCPIPNCGPGYKLVEKPTTISRRYEQGTTSAMFINLPTKKPVKSVKIDVRSGGVKGRGRRPTKFIPRKPLPEVPTTPTNVEECPVYQCISTRPPPEFQPDSQYKCPDVQCPPDYTVKYELGDMTNPQRCQEYICVPPPPKDAICEILPRTINTFDGTTYKYDICDHILARDLKNGKWDISVQEDCGTLSTCKRIIVINEDENEVVLNPDLTVKLNGYKYTVEQIQRNGAALPFLLTSLDNNVLFVSKKYGYWVLWNNQQLIKIGVSTKLHEKVDGLCGFYNQRKQDDKRMPNGMLAKDTTQFIDSWANTEHLVCEVKQCSPEIQHEVWETCNVFKNQLFAECATVININHFMAQCMESVCTCLGQNETSSKCRCNIIQDFVLECKSKNENVDLATWRIDFNCPVECPSPLVYIDCYNRRCERSCDNLRDNDPCPVVPDLCFSGCFCPTWLVRKGDTCVPPNECRNCECKQIGNGIYETYDGKPFDFNGNCSYVVTRDISSKNHDFQVIVSKNLCDNTGICVNEILILYNIQKITVGQVSNEKRLQVKINNEIINSFPFNETWIYIDSINSNKDVNVLITPINLEVTVQYQELTFQVRVPSYTYGSKLEGLCGNCNDDQADDFKTPTNEITNDTNHFGASWLVEELSSKDNCIEKPPPECVELPADASNPCDEIMNESIFGPCHLLVDVSSYVDSCEQDICKHGLQRDIVCSAIEKYSQECLRMGICTQWREQMHCYEKCPEGMEFKSCASGCIPTCDNYLSLKQEFKPCQLTNVDGCFCPDNMVLKNNTCIEPKYCKPCDTDGHYPGDQWQLDKCTTCTCGETGTVECSKEMCSSMVVCDKDSDLKIIHGTEDKCCPSYTCVPKPTGIVCGKPIVPVCGEGQIMKQEKTPDGCVQFICVCKPLEDCESIEAQSSKYVLEDGMKRIINTTGCCPLVEYICDKESCPKPAPCEYPYELQKQDLGKCCPKFECLPPKEKCIYQIQVSTIAGQKVNEESTIVVKNPNETWFDGPCRECICLYEQESPRAECKIIQCPLLSEHPDDKDYVLELQPQPGQCCMNIVRVKCKYEDEIHEVGETWASKNDSCTKISCVQEDDGNIVKRSVMESCDRTCKLGFKYVEPEDPTQCCGSCTMYACVFNEKLYNVGEKWSSADNCTKYYCSEDSGDITVEKSVVTCPEVSPETASEYEVEEIEVEGACCKAIRTVGCKDNGVIYKLGDVWTSSNDSCIKITCIGKDDGNVMKQAIIEACDQTCKIGWEYVPPTDPNQCCGSCSLYACVINGTLHNVGDRWNSSDNCIMYHCSNDSAHISVEKSNVVCPEQSDEVYAEFEIEQLEVEGECCKKIEVIGCKDGDAVYKIGETWTSANDSCLKLSCVKQENGKVVKQSVLESCDKSCGLGWKYVPPEDPKDCCGTCNHYACVVNGSVYNVGEKWSSVDNCTHYYCSDDSGHVSTEISKTVCPETTEEEYNEFDVEELIIEGACCKQKKIVGCKVNEVSYKVGETWPSPDGDPCKTFTCLRTSSGDIIKQEKIENCNENCAEGWSYQESTDPHVCCGQCVATACVFTDGKHPIDSELLSADNCTKYTCINNNGSLTVITSPVQECPSTKDCDPEYIIQDGCCPLCIQPKSNCKSVPMKVEETVGMIQIYRKDFGLCKNLEQIHDFMECVGTCDSYTQFNSDTFVHDSNCTCCQPSHYKTFYIKLTCANGVTFDKPVTVPDACQCIKCGENLEELLMNVKGKQPTKTVEPVKTTYAEATKGGRGRPKPFRFPFNII